MEFSQPTPTATPSRPALKSGRITVVQQVYHQIPNNQPRSFEKRYQRDLCTDEEPYQGRRLVLKSDEGWQILDFGWVEKVGLVFLTNLGPGVLEILFLHGGEEAVGVQQGDLLLLQEESIPLHPREARKVRVRAATGSGECRYSAAIIPA